MLSLVFASLKATHNRAGEITYVQLSDLTYEITITTFTYTLSLADRPSLDVEWGDNTTSNAPRVSMLTLPNFYRRNIYKIVHTFPGPGVYRIVVQDPNRNAGVKNIPNSVNVVFSMSTILTVNPAMGRNNTPVLLNPPYDKAAYGFVFIHNPAAYDPDGDSLSYKITICTREDGKPIENYTFPPATNLIWVDSISGDLVWDTPADTGIFNVAMEIQEWRNTKKIGVVVRDMQIEVFNTKNKPPVNGPLSDYCVEVGDTIDFIASATDENSDSIILRATSGVFSLGQCRAAFIGIDSSSGASSSRFRWIPCHEAVRNQPYNVIFKSDDNNPEVRLSDIDNINIKVLGPPPTILNAVPEGKLIRLTWADYGTPVIAGFSIYRRVGASAFSPDSCTSGLPPSTGFVKVGYIDGSSTTSWVDNENGQGLQFGREYTYRIVAVYPNGTESKASNEISSTLVSGVPVITNVSVINTDPVNGTIFVAWRKPNLDTIPTIGPYEFVIYRAEGIGGTEYVQINTISTATLNDTTFTDVLDTESRGYIYKIELWNNTPGNRFQIGEPAFASSVFLQIFPGDRKARFNINRNVPWINTGYDFFRLNELTSTYDSIGTTNQLDFVDIGLDNGKQYCYYIRSTGGYPASEMPKNLINLSQIVCTIPIDNEPPCRPEINVTSQCDSLYNTISWTVPDTCFADVAKYYIYYKKSFENDISLLDSIPDKNIFSYRHLLNQADDVIAGCYAVSAIDMFGNESQKSLVICVDSCNFYEIPNVFTPNGDNINDLLVAKTSGLVEKIDFKLFNRNGLLLFQTDEPRIEWDGTYQGRIVSPGVYFYQCDVYERRISGLELFHLSGFVHVITEEDSVVNELPTK